MKISKEDKGGDVAAQGIQAVKCTVIIILYLSMFFSVWYCSLTGLLSLGTLTFVWGWTSSSQGDRAAGAVRARRKMGGRRSWAAGTGSASSKSPNTSAAALAAGAELPSAAAAGGCKKRQMTRGQSGHNELMVEIQDSL